MDTLAFLHHLQSHPTFAGQVAHVERIHPRRAEYAELDRPLAPDDPSPTLHRILAAGEVSPQKHVGRIAEDIAAGATVLPAGRILRPQDVGVLASIGTGEVSVVRRPRVRIVVTMRQVNGGAVETLS